MPLKKLFFLLLLITFMTMGCELDPYTASSSDSQGTTGDVNNDNSDDELPLPDADNSDSPVVGTWTVTTKWYNLPSIYENVETVDITFYSNETLINSLGETGTWFFDSELIGFWYDDNQLSYEGNVYAASMNGRAVDNAEANPVVRTWTAIRN